MQPKPFILRHQLEGTPFAIQFLASDDFDIKTIKNISRDLGGITSGNKSTLIQHIEGLIDRDRDHISSQVILRHLIQRKRKWFTYRKGNITNRPVLNDPSILIIHEGKPEWYGPFPDLTNELIAWYIRPFFPVHWEMYGDPEEPVQRQIRWLCFARVEEKIASLHWQGFTISEDANSIEHGSQFPYWFHIPRFFDELENLLEVELEPPNFHNLALFTVWEKFRGIDGYTWTDLRIRAESGGVSLSARSAAPVIDLDVRGINHLARTLGQSVRVEVRENGLDLPDSVLLEETLLRTLIREFGAKSYEFALESENERLFKGHIYFGMKPDTPTPDSFPHVNSYTTWLADLKQLQFLITNSDN